MQLTEQMKKTGSRLVDTGRTIGRTTWLAGLGTVSLIEERGRRFLDDGTGVLDDLVERGRTVEREGKREFTARSRIRTATSPGRATESSWLDSG